MSFGESFARGYAIGDSAKKRQAASKFFEKFKELTDEGEGEDTTEIGGLAVPTSALPDSPAPQVSALPVDASPEAAANAPLLSADTAIPDATVSAPAKIPLASGKVRKSLTQANIKDLDRLAMDAARASGDIEVYTALQKTTDSFLQGKVLKNLGLAQSAAQNGDTDEVEKYMKAAYRFVPDGQEINFHKKDGKLMIKDPWDDKDVELSSEMIGNIGTMLHDPQKWSDIVRSERKDRANAKVQQQEADAKTTSAEADRDRVVQFGRQLGIQESELALKDRQVKLQELMGPFERMGEYQKALYYGALKDQANAASKAGKLPEFLDEARAMSESVGKDMDGMIVAPRDQLGNPLKDWTPSKDAMVMGLNGQPRAMGGDEMNQAKGLAQTIAMENRGTIGNQVAIAAGLLLTKAQLDPEHFNAQIDLDKGVMLVPFRGMNVPVKLPAGLVQSLASPQAKATTEESPLIPSYMR